MWHQPFIAFVRYIYGPIRDIPLVFGLFVAFTSISLVSYHFIEQPARKLVVKSPYRAIPILISINAIILLLSFGIYSRQGIVRQVPILGRISGAQQRIMSHGEYNDRVHSWKLIPSSKKKQIMVFGNSYARDFANVVFEKFGTTVEIGYVAIDVYDSLSYELLKSYSSKVDLIFVEDADYGIYGGSSDKIYCVGPKNFGENNGKLWNDYRRGIKLDSTSISNQYYDTNMKHKARWGSNYIDMLTPLSRNGKIRCVDDKGYLLSEDCRHLTREGAVYYSQKLSSDLERIIEG